MIEDELRRALTGSLGQQQAGEIAREVAPILERHPLLGVLGPSQVVSAALPTITFLAQSSPNASAKEIAQDWQKAQAGSVGQSKEEPKKETRKKGRHFWKR
jgi:hypothetical protein